MDKKGCNGTAMDRIDKKLDRTDKAMDRTSTAMDRTNTAMDRTDKAIDRTDIVFIIYGHVCEVYFRRMLWFDGKLVRSPGKIVYFFCRKTFAIL